MKHQIVHIPQWFGAGLGNEFFPFAKANLAAQSVGGKVLYPLQLDFVRRKSYFLKQWSTYKHISLYSRPKVFYYSAEEFLKDSNQTGTLDYGRNVQNFVSRLPSGPKKIIHGGMSGGFQAIVRARPFILEYLLTSVSKSDFPYSRIASSFNPNRIRIGIHIRRGDFLSKNSISKARQGDDKIPSTTCAKSRLGLGTIFKNTFGYNRFDLGRDGIQGKGSSCQTQWNQRIPIQWTINMIKSITKALPDQVEFLFVTDGLPDTERSEIEKVLTNTPFHWGTSNIPQIDLLLLSFCDSLICSTSSFSMWAAFLSEASAVFYRDHLSENHTSAPYFWNKPSMSPNDTPKQIKWFAVGESDSNLPLRYLSFLDQKAFEKTSFFRSPLMGGAFNVT